MRTHPFASIVLALAVLPGCSILKGSLGSVEQDSNTVFARHVEGPVSVAWRTARGEIWMVPKRGVFFEQISASGRPAAWTVQGSYVVIYNNPQQISLLVDGRWWAMPVSWDNTSSHSGHAQGMGQQIVHVN